MRLDSKLVRVMSGLTLAVAASLSASAHEDAKLLPAVKVRQTALFGVASGQVVHVAVVNLSDTAVSFGPHIVACDGSVKPGVANAACGRGEAIALPAVQLGPNEAFAWDLDPATLDIPRGAFGRTHLRVQAEVSVLNMRDTDHKDPTTRVLHTIEVIDRETGRATLFMASPEVAGDGSV